MTGTFQKDTKFTATAAQQQVLTLVPELIQTMIISMIGSVYIVGYQAQSKGSLSPDKIGGYTVVMLASKTVEHPTSDGMQYTTIAFDSEPSFTTLVLDISGTKVTFTKSSSTKTRYFASSVYNFANPTYTIKVVSIE